MNKTTRVDRREPEVGLVEVVPGLLFPGSGVTVFESHHPSGLTLEVDVVPEDGRLVVDCVRASRGSDGQPVTLVALRQVALKPFLKLAMSNAFVTLAVKEGAALKQALSDEYKGHVFWACSMSTTVIASRRKAPLTRRCVGSRCSTGWHWRSKSHL